jgi:hypothetical protein
MKGYNMKQAVHLEDFRNSFQSLRPNNFSYEGLAALFDYLENYENDTGEELDLDVIAVCCDYTEYKTLEDFNKDFGKDYKSIQEIEDDTTVIKVSDSKGFIIQNF